jgi:hypothetical protein
MALTPISGEIQAQTLNDNFSFLNSQINTSQFSIINVKDPAYGAVGDGIVDDTVAIQAAIEALKDTGGVVVFPPGTYLITSSIVVGNGTSLIWSTKKPVILKGIGGGGSPGPYWAGPSVFIKSQVAGPAIKVQGPINSWGIENMAILADTTSPLAVGLGLYSAQFGGTKNLTISGFYAAGIIETTVGTLSLCEHNVFDKTWILLPAAGANARGVIITGTGDYGCGYEEYRSLYICLTAATQIGIILGMCDNINFFTTEIVNAVNGVAIQFNYANDATFLYRTSVPSDCSFHGIDVYGNTIVNYAPDGYGPPPALSPNRIYRFSRTNSATVPRLYNLAIINDAGTLQCKARIVAAQSIGNAATKVALDTIIHDYDSIFNAANNRIIPTRPGVYRVSAHLAANSYVGASMLVGMVYKNGSVIAQSYISNNGVAATSVNSTDVYMNGTTDYLELWGLITGGSTALIVDLQDTFLSVVGPFGL